MAINLKFWKNEKKEGFWSLLKKMFGISGFRITLLSIIFVSLILGIFFWIRYPVRQENINYGVNFSDKYATEMMMDWKDVYIKILDDLGAKNIRLVAYWDDIEKENDKFDYSNIKWQLDEAQKRDVNVILAVGKKVPRWPECFEPKWWQKMSSSDEKEHELIDFVKRTVVELKPYGAIKIWQVENEPFFPFGECSPFNIETLDKEISIVRSLDARPILTQDSGEGGFWVNSFKKADYLGISMYRKIWYDFWGFFGGDFIYFKYPLANWSYKLKADLLRIPYDKIIITELQGEPWGPGLNSLLDDKEKDKTMSVNDFLSTITYAQNAGFKDLYFWGAEWWLWEKEKNNNPYYWETARALFRNSN